MAFLHSRSCHNRLFLSAAFCFAMWSSWSVHESIVIISKSCCGVCQKSLIRVNRSMSSISCEGRSGFFGAPGTCFGALLSFSSTSANPSRRVHDWDRRELSLLSCSCSLAFGGVLPAWRELLLLILRILKGGDCILGWFHHWSLYLLFWSSCLWTLIKNKNLKRINKDGKKFA